MATITVFGASLLTVTILFALKSLELRFGRKNFILNLLGKLDPKSDKFISALKFRSLQAIQSVRYIILVQSKETLKELLRKAEARLAEEYRTRHSVIMGHRKIAGNGSASFYLKKITEHKGAKRGKIEESL